MKKPAMPRHIGPWPAIRCLCLCAVVLANVRPGNGLQDNTPNLATIIATFEFAQHPPPNWPDGNKERIEASGIRCTAPCYLEKDARSADPASGFASPCDGLATRPNVFRDRIAITTMPDARGLMSAEQKMLVYTAPYYYWKEEWMWSPSVEVLDHRDGSREAESVTRSSSSSHITRTSEKDVVRLYAQPRFFCTKKKVRHSSEPLRCRVRGQPDVSPPFETRTSHLRDTDG